MLLMNFCQIVHYVTSFNTQHSTLKEQKTSERGLLVLLLACSPKGLRTPVDPFLAVALNKCVATYSFDECQDTSNHQFPRRGSMVFTDE